MKEVKLELPKRRLLSVHKEDQAGINETLQTLESEPKEWVYLEACDDDNFVQIDGGDTVTRTRCFNINGVQWFVPVQERTQVPRTIYNLYQQQQEVLRRPPRIRPNHSVYLGKLR